MNEPSPDHQERPAVHAQPQHLDPALAEVLAGRDVACPGCGYNLRGLRTADCPECGQTVTWDGLLRPTSGIGLAWAIGLVGLAVSLPESFLKWQRLAYRRLFFYGEQEWHPHLQGYNQGGYTQPEVSVFNPWFVGSTLYWHLIPLAMVAWWVGRNQIARWPWWARWGAGLAWVVAAVLGHRRWMWWYLEMGLSPWGSWPLWYID